MNILILMFLWHFLATVFGECLLKLKIETKIKLELIEN